MSKGRGRAGNTSDSDFIPSLDNETSLQDVELSIAADGTIASAHQLTVTSPKDKKHKGKGKEKGKEKEKGRFGVKQLGVLMKKSVSIGRKGKKSRNKNMKAGKKYGLVYDSGYSLSLSLFCPPSATAQTKLNANGTCVLFEPCTLFFHVRAFRAPPKGNEARRRSAAAFFHDFCSPKNKNKNEGSESESVLLGGKVSSDSIKTGRSTYTSEKKKEKEEEEEEEEEEETESSSLESDDSGSELDNVHVDLGN